MRYSITKAFCIAFKMTFFPAFDVPVFWPILLCYWIVLFILTMKRQIAHTIKYRYVPLNIGKQVKYFRMQKYGGKKPAAASASANGTLNVLQYLLFRDVFFLKGFADLFLPQRDELIEGVCVISGSDVEDLVQRPGIIHCFYGVSGNVVFPVENRCNKIKLAEPNQEESSQQRSCRTHMYEESPQPPQFDEFLPWLHMPFLQAPQHVYGPHRSQTPMGRIAT
ncbi:hypothetical protein Cgig2_020144 [Carnegiea gigantea]|uniref:Uncharacterized protein n=1 Tax=Carnegiea gigantea TaxID=171969 RepID=A0A9Q1KFL9_9CARY|nr:hypothetical protein Cgig2_020144 [Carnegiea gigantea]